MTNIYDVLMTFVALGVVATFCFLVIMHETGKQWVKFPKCWPFHDWDNWEKIAEGDIVKKVYDTKGFPKDFVHGYWLRQSRTCVICGKTQIRSTKTEI